MLMLITNANPLSSQPALSIVPRKCAAICGKMPITPNSVVAMPKMHSASKYNVRFILLIFTQTCRGFVIGGTLLSSAILTFLKEC